jgi:hypothetical protein
VPNDSNAKVLFSTPKTSDFVQLYTQVWFSFVINISWTTDWYFTVGLWFFVSNVD